MRSWRKINAWDVAQVWRRNRDVYMRLWRTELIPPLLEPFFSVIGLAGELVRWSPARSWGLAT